MEFRSSGGDKVRDYASTVSPGLLFENARRPFKRIPDAWKQWIAQARLHNTSDEHIVEVLVRNGYGRTSAIAEVTGAVVS